MTGPSSNMEVPSDRTPQPTSNAQGGEQLKEDIGAAECKDVDLEQLLESDFDVWLRHFGFC
jgi:hypothetical protein